MVKNPPVMRSIPGLEDSLEEGMVTHSSILACRIPLDRGAGYRPWGSPRVGHNRASKHTQKSLIPVSREYPGSGQAPEEIEDPSVRKRPGTAHLLRSTGGKRQAPLCEHSSVNHNAHH